MWDRKETKDKVSKIICWVFAVVTAISLFAKGGATRQENMTNDTTIVKMEK